jgi:hypothetical protein
LLPCSQPGTAGCTIETLALFSDATLVEWAAAILGVSPRISSEEIDQLLKACGCIMTLAQIEVIASRVERGSRSFAFVENKKGGVSCLYLAPDVDDHGGRLMVFLDRCLDVCPVSTREDDRLFVQRIV